MATILIVGSGGREHALAWRCVHEGHDVVAAPGNDGIARLERARCVAIGVGEHGKLVELAVRAVVHGEPVKNIDALKNPEALEHFRDLPELAT